MTDTEKSRLLPNGGTSPCAPRKIERRAALVAAVAGLGGLAGRRWRAETRATARSIDPAGTPIVSVPGYDDAGRWRGRVVRAGSWGGEVQAILRKKILPSFAAATGCSIQDVVTDYSQLAQSQKDGSAYADALIADEIWAASAFDRGMVEPIPADTIDRSAFSPVAMMDGAVPAYSFGMVSAFRQDAVVRIGEPGNWLEWWDVKRYAGPRALRRGALGTFEFALLSDGVAPGDLYPLDGERAIERLKAISGKIVDRWWDSAQQPVAWLENSYTDFVPSWHFRVVEGKQQGDQIDFIWNEGLLMTDYWVVPKGAENRDVALDLIHFATTPEVQAVLATDVALGPVTPAALDRLDRETRKTVPTSPVALESLIPLNARWWAANQDAANERFNSWLLGVPFHE
jgi:putative spermidine/putrescine transport system substrate-binding protein